MTAHGQLADQRARRQLEAEPANDAGGVCVYYRIYEAQWAQPRRLPPQEHVAGNIEMGGKIQFLMDKDNAHALRHFDGLDCDRSPVKVNRPIVRALNAPQDFHEGRFAGAVLPHHCQDFARQNVQAHVVEGLDAGKLLANALRFEDGDHGRLANVT